MPIYTYKCPEDHVFDECFLSFKLAEPHKDAHPCTDPDCEAEGKRVHDFSGTALKTVGQFPGERIKKVDARKRRQIQRLDDKVKTGQMTEEEVDRMAAMRDKYAKASPYLTDPQELKDKSAEAAAKRESATGHFDDDEVMSVG